MFSPILGAPFWGDGDGVPAQDPNITQEVKFSGERRRCKHCLIYKPDRPKAWGILIDVGN